MAKKRKRGAHHASSVKKAPTKNSRTGPPSATPQGPSSITPAASPQGPSATDPAAGVRAKVRIYRHGLGDCILVRLRQRDGTDFKILIDFGVAVATQDAPAKMSKVLNDVIETSGGSVDVLAVTHEHWDHVSGFQQAKEDFERLKVGEVWVAWTEDETDALAKTLRNEHKKALAALTASAQALQMAGQAGRANGILNILSQFGAAGEKTAAAFDIAKAKAKPGQPRYWRPTDPPFHLAAADVKIYALGPPHDAQLIRKVLPSRAHPETYELALDGSGIFPAGVASALLDQEDLPPFGPTVTIPVEQARAIPFFQNHYWGTLGEVENWRRIDTEWLGAADDLALALQSATNNTSLVLAIELSGGDVLLFAGDAQVGNWLSWQDCKWVQDHPMVTGPDLLRRTVFYKVGHHGSHNATLREKGLEEMANLKTAVIPVDEAVAKKMRWGAMPLEGLVSKLQEKTNNRTLRTDKKPSDPIDGVTVTDLYYEFAL
jgi:beta-lactamase superfamily II metal-dependent hydrolase